MCNIPINKQENRTVTYTLNFPFKPNGTVTYVNDRVTEVVINSGGRNQNIFLSEEGLIDVWNIINAMLKDIEQGNPHE